MTISKITNEYTASFPEKLQVLGIREKTKEAKESEGKRYFAIYLKNNENTYKIEIGTQVHRAGSCWTVASIGFIKDPEATSPKEYYHYVPKAPITDVSVQQGGERLGIWGIIKGERKEIAYSTGNGGDEYYPSGEGRVHLYLFERSYYSGHRKLEQIFD